MTKSISKPSSAKKPAVTKSGAVSGEHGQQHVDLYRKLLLRRKLLTHALEGAAYVPFIGDGDIAEELYADRMVYGADLDPKRVDVASKRFEHCQVVVADCNGFPFDRNTDPIAVADFDSYSDPYAGFRAFWEQANYLDRLVVFFTDGHRQGIVRTGHWHKPDGSNVKLTSTTEKRAVFNTYYAKHILPWFSGFIDGWTILESAYYLRGSSMLYWGAAIERKKESAGKKDGRSSNGNKPGVTWRDGVYKFDDTKKAAYLELLRQGGRRHSSARAVGVTPQTVINHRESDPAFSDACDKAEMESDDDVESALRMAAVSGNVTAALAWLYSRRPERWKDMRSEKHEVTGLGGGPIVTTVREVVVEIPSDKPDGEQTGDEHGRDALER